VDEERIVSERAYFFSMISATKKLLEFRDEREWAPFHDPKNLAVALSIEAAELNEIFLWKTTEESAAVDVLRVAEELADVLAYALLLAEKFGLDPEQIVLEKIDQNRLKYPTEKSRGSSKKYTQL
jgi:NTP pyrophosphatase (non-canonical NTP hydrolase)